MIWNPSFDNSGNISKITIDRVEYIKKLEPISQGGKPKHMTQELHSEYRTLIAGLLWAVMQWWPDLAFGVPALSFSWNAPKIEHVNNILNKMKHTLNKLRYSLLRGLLRLVCYSEICCANFPDGATASVYLWTIIEDEPDEHRGFHLLGWRCQESKHLGSQKSGRFRGHCRIVFRCTHVWGVHPLPLFPDPLL